MAIKVSTKIGDVAVDFEGSPEEFKALILPLVEKAWTRAASSQTISEQAAATGGAKQIGPSEMLSVRTVATRLAADNGSELVLAAAASLSIFKGMDSFSRQQLHDEMKEASGFYKVTYGSNLSSYIDTLIKNRSLLELGKDSYALSVATRQSIEQRLA